MSHPWTGGDGRPEPGGERFVSSMFLPAYRQAFGGEPGQGLLPMLRFGLLAAGGILAAGSSGRTAAFAGDQWRAAEVADPGRFRFVLNLALGLPLPAASCSPLPAILHAASSLFSDIAKVPGAVNDFRQILFAKQPFCDWPKIACPVLILHNPDDPLVPFAHAEFAFAALTAVPASQKELVKLDVAGHLMWVGRQADEMAARRAEFLRRHSQN